MHTVEVLGCKKARDSAITLYGDVERSIDKKVNDTWERLKYHERHTVFEEYNNLNTQERIDWLTKNDYDSMRKAIMCDALKLYIEHLEDESKRSATQP